MANRSSSRQSSRRVSGSSGGSLKGTIVLLVVLALVAGGVATWRYDLLDGRLDDVSALFSGDSGEETPASGPGYEPATVAPPAGVEVEAVAAPPAVAEPSSSGPLAAAAVRRALAPYLDVRALGPHVLAAVAPLDAGRPVLTRGTDTALPASTTKLVTSSAALLALGADHVFTTSVVSGRVPGGARSGPRQIVLVGGGDPFLERTPRLASPDGAQDWPYPHRADLTTLARATAAALRADGVRRVGLGYDDGLFSGPAVNPTWEPDYVTDVVSETSALWVDEGRTVDRYDRVADPSAEAAAAFAAALGAAGITVVGTATEVTAPAGAADLASVRSAPLDEIVQRVLDVSDNEAAEVLLRHVGLATGGTGSIEAGRRGVRTLLTREGVDFGASVFHDGSGLSRADRVDPQTLLDVLRLAASADHPELRSVVSGLPVAGFTGSLADRMDQGPPAGLGRVRAKTGTLTSVSALAGIATGLDGVPMVFVLVADRVRPRNTDKAKVALDSAAAALGACRCGG